MRNRTQGTRKISAFACLVGLFSAADYVRPFQSDEFQEKVLPVFENHCFGCHGETMQRSDLDLRTRESILRGGSRGAAIQPGDAQNSLLVQLIRHASEPNMPLGGAKIADSEIARIVEWINGLAPITGPSHRREKTRPAGSAVSEADRKFWSFQKPVRPSVPQTRNPSWIRNEIDAFILQRLEDKGLAPSPPATPSVLIRRLYFDLIGLPPAPEEVESFVADPSERSYAQVIERLLASPHYGERWGRHWLDLARYADSGGFEFDYDRPHAWRYRDYVIRSFNDDKPYDQFVREQLAGDEIAPDDPEILAATGFCRNGPTVDNASNEQTRMDELDDIVSTTSSVFLGLTVGCARCHDHKYDPIPQKDYYRLQAIFFPSQKSDRLLASPKERDAFKATMKAFDERTKPFREKIAQIEKLVREQLLKEKVEFFTRLAIETGALGGKEPDAYRKMLRDQFAKDVKLQPEEIESRLGDQELKARKELQTEIDKINRERPKPLPAVMAITDKDPPLLQCHVLIRGDYRQKGEEVLPGFPTVLSGDPNSFQPPPPSARTTYRRRQLSDWLVSPANPLTARVMANRIWQYHFGKGLVRTPSDFGLRGERPTHPELLDWLATEFVAKRWSIKALHRLVVMSNTYRQENRSDPRSAAVDPENRLAWRMNPRRLEAEVIRDSILSTSGQLNRAQGGPGVYPKIDPAVIGTGSRNRWPVDVKEGPDVWRRSVYVFVKRSVALPLLEVFDCPDPTVSFPVRSNSTIAPQALALFNNEFVWTQAGYFALRVMQEAGALAEAQTERCFELALGRKPRSMECAASLDFLRDQISLYRKSRIEDGPSPQLPEGVDAAAFAALRALCHAVFNLNEFIYVD